MHRLPQARLRVWRKPLLENSHRLPGIPVLRLAQPGRRPLYLPRVRGYGVLTRSTLLRGLLLLAVGLGALLGALALSFGGTGWIFALLVLSAAVTAIAQQTLP